MSDVPGNVVAAMNPAAFSGAEWGMIGGSLLAAALISRTDVRTYRQIEYRWPNPRLGGRSWSYLAVLPGDGTYEVIGLLGAYGIGDQRLRDASVTAIEAVIATGLTVRAVKLATGVARPSDSPDRHRWWRLGIHHDAFPSGHTASAVAMTTVLAETYDASWLPYATGAVVAAGLIKDRMHWLSDCVAGAVIGAVIGRRALALHQPDAPRLVATGDGLRLDIPFSLALASSLRRPSIEG